MIESLLDIKQVSSRFNRQVVSEPFSAGDFKVRYLEDKPEERYRVVRWVPDRPTAGYSNASPLETADMAVTFMENEPHTGRQALTTERSPEWARFGRWFWSQAPDALMNDLLPAWAYRERMTQQSARTNTSSNCGAPEHAGP